MAEGYAHYQQAQQLSYSFASQQQQQQRLRRGTPPQTPSPSQSPAPQSPGSYGYYGQVQAQGSINMLNSQNQYMARHAGITKFFPMGSHNQPIDQTMTQVHNATAGGNQMGAGHQAFSGTLTNASFTQNNHTNAAANSAHSNSQHWQEQQTQLSASRASSEPHHAARQAAILNKNASANVTVAGGVNPNSYQPTSSEHRKDGPTPEQLETRNEKGQQERQDWIVLDLGGQGLRALSNSLFNYTFLDKLYINHNKLQALPPAIGKLKLLQLLDVSGNQLTSLPPEIGMLTNLRTLLLFDNRLTNLPYELGSLYQLNLLGIEANPLPEELKTLLYNEGTKGLIANLRDAQPVMLPPAERDWIVLDEGAKKDSKNDTDMFQVVCWNILCEKYATPLMYGYTAKWVLDWDFRKDLIRRHLLDSKSDIFCLQEVDLVNFNEYFSPEFGVAGYEGIFQPKSRAKTMAEPERQSVDGCAIYYNSSRFVKLAQHSIDFSQVAIQREDFKKTADTFNRVMPKDNIAIICLLENKATRSKLIVATVHITWDPQYRDVKLIQAAILLEQLKECATEWKDLQSEESKNDDGPEPPKYSDINQIPLVVCGDFNSISESGVYELISRGTISSNHEDLSGRAYGNFSRDGISHPFPLKSSYTHIGELKFTNYTPNFTGAIDYIWYTTNSLSVTGLLGDIDEKYLETVPGFPNVHHPSDHIPIQAEFLVKPPRKEITKPPPPDFGSTPNNSTNSNNGKSQR